MELDDLEKLLRIAKLLYQIAIRAVNIFTDVSILLSEATWQISKHPLQLKCFNL